MGKRQGVPVCNLLIAFVGRRYISPLAELSILFFFAQRRKERMHFFLLPYPPTYYKLDAEGKKVFVTFFSLLSRSRPCWSPWRSTTFYSYSAHSRCSASRCALFELINVFSAFVTRTDCVQRPAAEKKLDQKLWKNSLIRSSPKEKFLSVSDGSHTEKKFEWEKVGDKTCQSHKRRRIPPKNFMSGKNSNLFEYFYKLVQQQQQQQQQQQLTQL